MSRKLEMDVTVEPGDADKRQSLTNGIDMAIMFAGLRIRAGTYRVTIQRIPPSARVQNGEDVEASPPSET